MRTYKLLAAAVAAVLALGVSAIHPASTDAAPPSERPNIVVILVDDVPEIGRRFLPYLPNIRETFVDRGVRFDQMYVESPLCCPGRAGWLTGQHTFNHGVTRNDVNLFDPRMTLATQLDRAGYATVYSGKYFNQYGTIAPTVPPGWDHFHASAGGYYGYTVWNDGDPDGEEHGSKPADYSTDVYGAKLLAHLEEAPRDQPLLAWFAPFAAHGPNTPAPRHRNDARCGSIPGWAPPNYNERNVSDKPQYVRRLPTLTDPAYDLVDECRSLLAVDEWVGNLTHELTRHGRLNNTLLVLTSDNGMNYGAHRLTGKSTPYATQVPFFMSWPQRLGRNARTIRERLSNIDFAPTICEIAGCRLGPYPNGQRRPDGRSFASLLFGQADSMGRDALLEDMPAGGGGGVPAWYGLATTRESPWATFGCEKLGRVSPCRWHYVEYDTGERELYDVSNGPCWLWAKGQPGDPCELQNLAGDARYAQLEAALSARLSQLKSEFGGPSG